MAELKDSNNENKSKTAHAEREERILAYWKEKGIFEKTLEKTSPKGEYIFYDGPPFATGTPHYGHILAGTIKDVIPRFKTMQGYDVPRKWGWDCHGLPVENLIEKELGLKSKKDIVDYGIGRFNEAARFSVMRYADEWRKIVPRLGRFVDMDNDYRTMDTSYTESVWWVFKTLYDKGLIYEGFKSMNLCPHCETTLSNFEVAQGYRDITDISVYVKFKLTAGQKIDGLSVDKDTSVLAWTTTPWTLPGNVALAINPKIDYVVLQESATITIGTSETNKPASAEKIILAKDIFIANFQKVKPSDGGEVVTYLYKNKSFKIEKTLKGSSLTGLNYEPLFDYYSKDKSQKNLSNGWKIYEADFVTTEDGTGVVHIAPAFGADDYELLKKYNLPFVQHVSVDGKFKKEVTDFALMSVKAKDSDEDKNAHQKADIEVIKWLAHHGSLFEKEKLIHSYPHCWRCETPLLNYATSSWFVKVTDIKDKLVAENQKVTWVPPEVGSARFGNWLEGARDWAISRTRFWGAPIPIWKEIGGDGNVKKYHSFGSVEELRDHSKAKNTYYIVRHGEAENNTLDVLSGDKNFPHHLTEDGRGQVTKAAGALKKVKFDMVFASPFVRTQETLEILKTQLKWGDEVKINSDDRLVEFNTGSWNGKTVKDFVREYPSRDRFTHCPDGSENYADIKKRVGEFLYELEQKYASKTILIISHETPLFLLVAASISLNRKQSIALRGDGDFIANAEVRKLKFIPLPHNDEYELDLHRPYIDNIELHTENGNKLSRVSDVFDCWFESGSMPYGKSHYPFEKGGCGRDGFNPVSGLIHKPCGFPADFIAEGLDQTRGWFYSMLVLGVALFGKSPYKKVIVNGLVLAEDGEKMSKSKKNYPDPMLVVDRYGADALRYYMIMSPVVHGEDLRFSEKGVDEVTKKVINRILNVVTFYETYATEKLNKKSKVAKVTSQNIIDKWIIARLNETISTVSDGLENGELDRASRPFLDFVDDLSTWYLRRSRDRFKGDDIVDKNSAIDTTGFVLNEIAKLLAPFMPFMAEDIYLRTGGDRESVHLEDWPSAEMIDGQLLDAMKMVRIVASKGLEARMTAKINVRQPLKLLKVKASNLGGVEKDKKQNQQLIDLIKDEVNIKDVSFGAPIETDVELDTTMTPELKEEGELRELLRKIQDARKEKCLSVGDVAVLVATEDLRSLITKNEEVIKKATKLSAIEYGETLSLKS